ncbi:uncharacterized protein FFB20_06122 [Fusarium fujikuroi]|uniref:Uncharacterized protein n=2 Tax=Fusarium fujikuroi TaxID=5127 RepID=S0DJI5_GIBF5|nr:uncharacterized protein FFUJ_00962 [Fusarium fujikuroi IMI 58289]QGI58946.1 hypothetical protein CEK27_001071 [Fusarium fujikuroi]QGI76161.1 hypothetical protein CEK25_001067 [Fusarium fujikuroi]QGI89856.1 hypothetical protein CEK26_001071 [Fusarium fujikuroi]CCT62485.1 uncharacterized protein FFUJ_00962 [Fusarium fujikuroi IMI 58289]SCN67446.1 uncharacterized protein FFE2_01037 [Fusarium fujikuroi]
MTRVGGAEAYGQLPLTDTVPKPTPDVVPLHDSRHGYGHGTSTTQNGRHCQLELKPSPTPATNPELELRMLMWRLRFGDTQAWASTESASESSTAAKISNLALASGVSHLRLKEHVVFQEELVTDKMRLRMQATGCKGPNDIRTIESRSLTQLQRRWRIKRLQALSPRSRVL